jgi:hypothetical protein
LNVARLCDVPRQENVHQLIERVSVRAMLAVIEHHFVQVGVPVVMPRRIGVVAFHDDAHGDSSLFTGRCELIVTDDAASTGGALVLPATA